MPGNKNESSRYPLELTGKRYKCECPLTVGQLRFNLQGHGWRSICDERKPEMHVVMCVGMGTV